VTPILELIKKSNKNALESKKYIYIFFLLISLNGNFKEQLLFRKSGKEFLLLRLKVNILAFYYGKR